MPSDVFRADLLAGRRAVEALADRHAETAILVNNAGGQFPQKARDLSADAGSRHRAQCRRPSPTR